MDEREHLPGDHHLGPPADLLQEEQAQNLAAFFKALGDPTRVRMLYLLSQREHCVCEIAEQLGATMSGVSHQLRFLREARLVHSRREGKQIFYTLDDDHVRLLLQQGLEHLRHN